MGLPGIIPGKNYPLRRESTTCGAELACASAATRMRDSAAARLLNCVEARLTAKLNAFCPLPTTACAAPSRATGSASVLTAACALACEVMPAMAPPPRFSQVRRHWIAATC